MPHPNKQTRDRLTEAVICYNQKDYSGAISLLQSCLAGLPDEPLLYLLLAKCQTRINDLDAALESINRCIAMGFEDAEVVNQKGAIYLLLDKTVLAEKFLLEAVSMEPDFLVAITNLLALYHKLKNSRELNRWANKVVSLSADHIRKHLQKPDAGALYDAYAARAKARWHMEDVRDDAVLQDLQKAIAYYHQLPVTEQDQYDLDWLQESEQELLHRKP